MSHIPPTNSTTPSEVTAPVSDQSQVKDSIEKHIDNGAQTALAKSGDELSHAPSTNKDHNFSILSLSNSIGSKAKEAFFSAATVVAKLYNKVVGSNEFSSPYESISQEKSTAEDKSSPAVPAEAAKTASKQVSNEDFKKDVDALVNISKGDTNVLLSKEYRDMRVAYQAFSQNANESEKEALKEKINAMKSLLNLPIENKAEKTETVATPEATARSDATENPVALAAVKQTVKDLDKEYKSLLKEIDEFKKANPNSSNYVAKKELELKNAHSRAELNKTSVTNLDNLKTQMDEMRVALDKPRSSPGPATPAEINGNELHEAKKNLAEYRGISSGAIDETNRLNTKYKNYVSEADDKKMSKLVYELSVLQNDLDNLAEWGSTEKGKNMQGKAAELMRQIDAKAAELNALTADIEVNAQIAQVRDESR